MIGRVTAAGLVACLGLATAVLAAPTAESMTVSIAAVTTSSFAAPALVAAAAPTATSAQRYRSVATRELARLGSAIPKQDRVAIVDYSLPSSEPRLFMVTMSTGQVTTYRVTHGKGSDPSHTGRLTRFSSIDGSEATSRGAYRTAELYSGQHGRSMRLDGLDADNRSARSRAIVVHAAAYAEPSVVRAQGRMGRSQGCFAVGSADLTPVLDFLGQGRLLFADRL